MVRFNTFLLQSYLITSKILFHPFNWCNQGQMKGFFSRKTMYQTFQSLEHIPTLNFTVRSKLRHLVNFSATTIEQPIKLRAILISVFCQSKSHTTTCIDSRKPNVLYFLSTGVPRLARPPRPGPCLDFGFQK